MRQAARGGRDEGQSAHQLDGIGCRRSGIRRRSALAQAVAERLGAGRDHRRRGGRQRQRLDHPSTGSVEDNFKAAAVTPPVGTCCTPAPPVLQFDRDGNLIGHWGGPGDGYQWPESNHGITIDHKGNVWIGGNGDTDTHVLKFNPKGQFLLQIGRQGVHNGSNDPEHLWRAAKIFVDPSTNEAYIADGYGNRRVIVLDADTGKYKRHWGAYGEKPDDKTWVRTRLTHRRCDSSAPCTARTCRKTSSCTSATA